MLKKLLNIFLILVGLFLITFFTAIAGLKVIFTETRLKKLAADGIRGFISREAVFGTFSWGLKGIEIDNFSLSEIPDFKAGTFLTAKKIIIIPAFLPGRAPGSITVDSPSIAITALASKGWNISDVAGYVSMPKGSAASPRKRYLPASPSIYVNSGTIVFDGTKQGLPRTVIEGLSLNALGGSSILDAEVKAGIRRGGGRMDMAAKLTFDFKDGEIAVQRSELAEDGKSITVSGRITGLFPEQGKPAFDFDVSGDRAVLDSVLRLVSSREDIQFGEKRGINLNISGSQGNIKIMNRAGLPQKTDR